MSDRWTLEWHSGTGWQQVVQGRSRIRAAIVLFICTMARPDAPHRLLWKQAAVPMNTKWYGVVTEEQL